MIDLELFFQEKPATPDWFRNHPIFKDVKKVNKIFPSLGLPNFSVDSDIEGSNVSSTITNLCSAINSYLNNAKYHFDIAAPAAIAREQAHAGAPAVVASKNNCAKDNKFAPAAKLVGQLYNQLAKPKAFITQFNLKNGLYIIKDIVHSDGTLFAKQGEGLFKVYQKLAEFCSKHYNYQLIDLSTVHAFKEFSANNLNGKMQIVFSSDGIDGAWDILTMSQRGINSCQSWNGQYKNCTIGSVLDPFTAIIYLTAGTPTEFGSKMIRRCIVRFVVDRFMKRPCLYLEYMYPNEHPATVKAFKEAIRAKIGNKFPIVSLHNGSADKYYVPYNSISQELLKHSTAANVNYKNSHNYGVIFPYRDTYVEYKLKSTSVKDTQYDILRDTELAKFASNLSLNTSISNNYVNLIKATIAEEIFNKVDKQMCTTSNDYLRKTCIKYFAGKLTTTKLLAEKLSAEMKVHKDKSIFIPGVLTKLAKTTSKTKKSAGDVAKDKVQKPTTLELTEKHVMPAIAEMFKNIWQNIIVTDNKTKTKAKPKAKTKLVARLVPPRVQI